MSDAHGGCCSVTNLQIPQPADIVATPAGHRLLVFRPPTYGARLRYASAAALQVMLFGAAVVVGVAVGFQALRRCSTARRTVILLSALAAGLIIGQVVVTPRLTPATFLLMEKTVAVECPIIPQIQLLLDRLTLALAFFLTIVTGLTLIRPFGTLRQRLRTLAANDARATAILTVSTMFLAGTVFRIVSLGHWIATYFDGGKSNVSVQPLLDAVAQVWGLYFSIMLAAVYIPAAVVLRSRTARAAQAMIADARPAWFDPAWLKTSPWQMLTRLAAILAPFLAGQAADLLRLQ